MVIGSNPIRPTNLHTPTVSHMGGCLPSFERLDPASSLVQGQQPESRCRICLRLAPHVVQGPVRFREPTRLALYRPNGPRAALSVREHVGALWLSRHRA